MVLRLTALGCYRKNIATIGIFYGFETDVLQPVGMKNRV